MSTSLPHRLYTAAHVRELDRIAIEDLSIPGYTLMQRAASFSYGCLKQYWPETHSILVLCGGGNNAGDGYMLASIAIQDDNQVTVVALINPEKLVGDAQKAFQDFIQAGGEVLEFDPTLLKGIDIVVDAIFGTGLDRDIEGEIANTISCVNASTIPVMSLDIPSGLNADTGSVMNVAIQSDITPTFIGLKQGMLTHNGPKYAGEIIFNDLDVPDEVYRRLGNFDAALIEFQDYLPLLAQRDLNAHKGHFGHILVIGGDTGYTGAAQLAAEAALRVGAGLVSIATRKTHAAIMNIACPEIMSHGVEEVDELKALLKQVTVVIIGPGLGQSEWSQSLLACVLETSLPLVVDADALNLLAKEPEQNSNWVLTPHPGEAARLLETDTPLIQSDRFTSATKLQEKYQGVIVLKGCGSVIADSNAQLHICPAGNPGMSSGGMGDVLSGVIGGLLAQHLSIDDSATLGVTLHATAADIAAAEEGQRGLLASDLFPYLRQLVNT